MADPQFALFHIDERRNTESTMGIFPSVEVAKQVADGALENPGSTQRWEQDAFDRWFAFEQNKTEPDWRVRQLADG